MVSDLQIIDSHTEGEPTRTVVEGFPKLAGATMLERREDFSQRFDHLRSGLVREPRGHNAVVGALLTPPVARDSSTGVIFFNDVGYLGMCGHGSIGVAETLRFMGRAEEVFVLDTPVGTVRVASHGDHAYTIQNVPSRPLALDVSVPLGAPYPSETVGDLAYGGNGFFFAKVDLTMLRLENLDYLLSYSKALRSQLQDTGLGVVEGVPIDHIELYAPIPGGIKNFVLCPGSAYDRSPCGTGTSAKLALMAERGELGEGEILNLESITGGRFKGHYIREGKEVVPFVTGRAFVTGRYSPIFAEEDPFAYGF